TPLLPVVRPAPPPEPRVAPQFLTEHEFALLDELSELVIPADPHSPGARAAQVAAYIDGRLAESLDPEWQALWRTGLQAVEDLSRELHGKALLEASPDQRIAVLTRMAAGERDPKTPPERFFRELKGWTVRSYYTSKIGIHLDQEYQGNVYQRGEYAGYDAT
ncbi:MAG TPA: gluconate 2-dehydrogenase subunit 3 family protein, partial [Gemmatimonadales bacterium]|nr:gluconate 2-dehydrogenase subunit 3 family protein [Gemmatimonadales bacterium]